MAGAYLLVKRGLYYGPDNRGYTGIKDRAGRYHESDADDLSGITAIHEDEAPLFAPACWEDVKVEYLLDRITRLEADKAVLRDRLSTLAFRAYEYAGDYLLDERDDPELCAGFPNQHERILALFDAIEDADSALSRIQGDDDSNGLGGGR